MSHMHIPAEKVLIAVYLLHMNDDQLRNIYLRVSLRYLKTITKQG